MDQPPPTPLSPQGFAFATLGRGRLALWHRPPVRALPRLRDAGITDVVTLLCAREGAQDVGSAVEQAGMCWIWVPLENGRPPGDERTDEFRRIFQRLSDRLDEGATLLLHCSAGIHRTGMVASGLLHHRGLTGEDVLATIRAARSVTANGVGPRIEWGSRFSAFQRPP